MTDFNLNDKSNLNPSVGVDEVPKFSGPEKKDLLDKWNSKPYVKGNGIIAVDKKTLLLKNIAIATLIIISLTAVIFAYTAWKDGTLLDPPSNCVSSPVTCGDCGNVTLNTTCPACPACNLSCGNITIQPILNITINSS